LGQSVKESPEEFRGGIARDHGDTPTAGCHTFYTAPCGQNIPGGVVQERMLSGNKTPGGAIRKRDPKGEVSATRLGGERWSGCWVQSPPASPQNFRSGESPKFSHRSPHAKPRIRFSSCCCPVSASQDLMCSISCRRVILPVSWLMCDWAFYSSTSAVRTLPLSTSGEASLQCVKWAARLSGLSPLDNDASCAQSCRYDVGISLCSSAMQGQLDLRQLTSSSSSHS
jgi:hypothetical protein